MCLHHLVQNQKSPPLTVFFNVATRKYKIVCVTHIMSPLDKAAVDVRFLTCKYEG